MKGFGRLFVNELQKIWKQTAYRVLIICMVAIALVIPVLQFAFSSIINTSYYYFPDIESIKKNYESYADWEAERMQSILDETNGDMNEEEREEYDECHINYVYYKTYAESCDFFIDNNITERWKWDKFNNEYARLYVTRALYRAVKAGELDAEAVEQYLMKYYGVYFNPDNTDFDAEIAAIENDIMTYEYWMVVRDYSDKIEEELKFSELNLAELKAELDADPDNVETKYYYNCAKVRFDIEKADSAVLKKMVERRLTPDDWQYILFTECYYGAEAMYTSNAVVMPKELYDKQDDYVNYISYESYESYLKDRRVSADYYKTAMDEYLYSIENNIPYSGVGGNVTKKSVESGISSFMSLFMILSVVLVSTVISNEFSSGTARLLLIRPRSRTQIIMSKLAAVMAVFAGVTIAVYILINIECAVMYGGGDIFADDITVIFGKVVAVPAVLSGLYKLLLECATVVVYVAMAAFFACLTRKAAIPIIVAIGTQSVVSVVSMAGGMISRMFPGVAPLFAYTPLGYFSGNSIPTPGQEYAAMNSDNIFDLINMVSGTGQRFMLGYRSWIGLAYCVLFAGLFTYFAVLVFRKKQIKS